MAKLKGKIALISGGSSGAGAASAKRLRRPGRLSGRRG
jgi:NADP-dependent 3-hydroxy acid dehydrogenase YdfG